jgi:hypothetical protein
MEAAEAVVNFACSLDMHRAKHTKYVGDGNSPALGYAIRNVRKKTQSEWHTATSGLC